MAFKTEKKRHPEAAKLSDEGAAYLDSLSPGVFSGRLVESKEVTHVV